MRCFFRRYTLQPLLSSDLKPVVFIPINTWTWGGQHVLLAGCLFFLLSGVYRRTAPHKHGNIAASTHRLWEEMLGALIHFIGVFILSQLFITSGQGQ